MDSTDPNKNANLVCVASPKPYPPIQVEGVNSNYASYLSFDLADKKSEFTTVNQYLYQHWILKKEESFLAETLMRIAMVEMHHLNILGQLIVLLGGNPAFGIKKRNYWIPWNGNMVNYNQNMEQILKENLKEEEYTKKSYLEQAEEIKDPYISAVLRRIAEDEQVHISLFERILSERKQ